MPVTCSRDFIYGSLEWAEAVVIEAEDELKFARVYLDRARQQVELARQKGHELTCP